MRYTALANFILLINKHDIVTQLNLLFLQSMTQ